MTDIFDFSQVMIDVLHKELRIADKFLDIIKAKLIETDNNSGPDLMLRPAFSKFLLFLSTVCKIQCPAHISENGEWNFRSWNKNDRILFLKAIADPATNFEAQNYGFQPVGLEKCYDRVFADFFKLNQIIENVGMYPTDFSQLSIKLRQWLKRFQIINLNRPITPYIHMFVYHFPELLAKHNVSLYTLQGIEKMNDFSSINYHSHTNRKRKNNAYITQLINQANRDELHRFNFTSEQLSIHPNVVNRVDNMMDIVDLVAGGFI
jgi:hypothetical protein